MTYKFTKQEALEHMALACYQQRRRAGMLQYGSAENDMGKAKSVIAFFNDFNGIPKNSEDRMTFEDYEDFGPLYDFLKENLNPNESFNS